MNMCAASLMLTVQIAADFPPQVPVAQSSTLTPSERNPASVQARPVGGGQWEVCFSLRLEKHAERVQVAGDFNGWSVGAAPASEPRAESGTNIAAIGRGNEMLLGSDGTWRTCVTVASGQRLYKFVIDGTQWIHDPLNQATVDDGQGGRNSVLRLGALANLDPSSAHPADGKINADALGHDQKLPMFMQADPSGGILLRYRTLLGDVSAVTLATSVGGESPMGRAGSDELFDWWEAVLPASSLGAQYTFVVHDAGCQLRDREVYQLDASNLPPFRLPEWSKDAIWYQVMLDRFRDGDARGNAPQTRPWTSEWKSPSEWETASGQTFYNYFVFKRLYGGDLGGLREKLQYLKDLGVNALYLNPVFQAASHHKYEATNFIHIDEHFGTLGDYASAEANENLKDPSSWTWTETDRLFLEFLRHAKSMGFRVIIDGVFNHVGVAHPAFKDVREKGEKSLYKDWFSIRSFEPFVYDGWAGFGDLPVFAKDRRGFASDEVKQHIFAITRRWMDPDGDGDPADGIDGWRLDVPNEIAMPFWREWRTLVKSINPDAYIVGEVWRRGDDWLDGTTMDAVMNYPFADTVMRFIGDRVNSIPPSEVDRRLAELRRAYPSEVTFALQNLLDSHDTDRIASKMFNPDREFDQGNREQSSPEYRGGKPDAVSFARARLAAFMQMTYPGAPMIYYGDEVGMWGSDDPNNRKPMLWDDIGTYDSPLDVVDPQQLAWYQRITALRHKHRALRRGCYQLIAADDEQGTLVFLRSLPEEQVLVAINASERVAVVDVSGALTGRAGAAWTKVFGDGASFRQGVRETSSLPAAEGRLGAVSPTATVTVPPLSGAAWVQTP